METIGFIGSGNMAEAFINGVLKAGVYLPGKVYVSDVHAGADRVPPRALRRPDRGQQRGTGVQGGRPGLERSSRRT